MIAAFGEAGELGRGGSHVGGYWQDLTVPLIVELSELGLNRPCLRACAGGRAGEGSQRGSIDERGQKPDKNYGSYIFDTLATSMASLDDAF